MPITKELKNIQKLESVGFDHKQAETLADIIEESHVDSHTDMKEFIRQEIKDLRNEFNIKFERILSVTDNIDTHIKAGQYDLLIKIFAIVTGTAAMLFAVLKLFG